MTSNITSNMTSGYASTGAFGTAVYGGPGQQLAGPNGSIALHLGGKRRNRKNTNKRNNRKNTNKRNNRKNNRRSTQRGGK